MQSNPNMNRRIGVKFTITSSRWEAIKVHQSTHLARWTASIKLQMRWRKDSKSSYRFCWAHKQRMVSAVNTAGYCFQTWIINYTELSPWGTRKAITHAACQKLHKFGFNPGHLAQADVVDIEMQLHPVGFYKTKAKHLKNLSQILIDDYDSDIPGSFEELVKLPGLGPKMSECQLNWNLIGWHTIYVTIMSISICISLFRSYHHEVGVERDNGNRSKRINLCRLN